MSQAEDLLNSLAEDEVVVTSAEPATEPHIVINKDKTVTIPEQLKRILVQYEHNIETVTFDCPRYWDGHDLSTMGMKIVFQRSDGHKEPHPVENLRVDESDDSMIHFDWTISRNTTLAGGEVRITVCAKIADTEGIVDREWHTIPNQDLYVNEGMDCSDDEIVEEYPDIIESILVRLDLAEQGGASDEKIAAAVEAYMTEHPVEVPDSGQNGNGLSTTAVNLLMDVLNAVQYHTNVSGKIEQLREALLSDAGSGGTDGGDTPDESDEPVVVDDITVSDGVMTIVTVGSAITVSDGVMTIA